MNFFTRHTIYIVIITLYLCLPEISQSEMTLEWVKIYNGNGRAIASGLNAMAVDDSGYVYITGLDAISSPTPNISDAYLVKYNAYGDSAWHRFNPGLNNVFNSPIGIGITSWGTVFWGISGGSAPGESYPILIKYISDGELLKTGSFEEIDYYTPLRLFAYSKSLNRIFISGDQMHISGEPKKVYHFGIDDQFTAVFKKYYDQPANPGYGIYPKVITIGNIGNVYIAGWYEKLNGQGWFLLKYGEDGILQWDRLFNDITFKQNKNIELSGIAIDNDKNVFLCGHGYFNP